MDKTAGQGENIWLFVDSVAGEPSDGAPTLFEPSFGGISGAGGALPRFGLNIRRGRSAGRMVRTAVNAAGGRAGAGPGERRKLHVLGDAPLQAVDARNAEPLLRSSSFRRAN
jgi:hypothetical protein